MAGSHGRFGGSRIAIVGITVAVVAAATSVGVMYFAKDEGTNEVGTGASSLMQQASAPMTTTAGASGTNLKITAVTMQQEEHVVSDQMIVNFKPKSKLARMMETSAGTSEVSARLSRLVGYEISYVSSVSDNGHVFRLAARPDRTVLQLVMRKIGALDGVEDVIEDEVFFPTLTANDSLYGEQWHLLPVASDWSLVGINVERAWDTTTGKSDAVIAVLDTGITSHTDLNSKLLSGYDFVTDSLHAADGNGRDPDPSDEGDFVTPEEATNIQGPFFECPVRVSSWHGTHVAGIAAAAANNGVGVAGINWNARVLPVRVLGKCGGYMSDIAAAIRWAAGVAVRGVPNNANPANVINMSFGTRSTCSAVIQSAIADVRRKGVGFVAAAGNSMDDASKFSPANCAGVMAVGATGRTGDRAWYSNAGRTVKISAPGGDTHLGGDAGAILSTLNAGTTRPAGEAYGWLQGTSMAAPQVAAAMSLVLASNDRLSADDATAILMKSATPFGDETSCAVNRHCGIGILNAGEAVKSALETKPDLVVDLISVPYSYWIPGEPMDATIRVANVGRHPVRENAVLKLYLSSDSTLDAHDRLAGDMEVPLAVAPGKSQNIRTKVDIPRTLLGKYRVIARINDGAGIAELNTENNVGLSPVVSLEQPNFEVSVAQYNEEVPSRVKLTLAPRNPALKKLVMDSSWVYNWDIPEGVTVISTSRNVANILIEKPGTYRIGARVRNVPRELTTLNEKEVDGIIARPFEIGFKTRSSNPYMREPVDIAVEPVISGGHTQDRIIAFQYDLNGGAATSEKAVPVFRGLGEGTHTVTLNATSKFGVGVTAIKQITVVANREPTCALSTINTESLRRLTFIAKCSDPDGRIKRYDWTVNGSPVYSTGDRLSRDYTGTGSMEVSVKATDDSGASATASIVASF